MEIELTKRKSCRIPGYDYSQNGAYFITICTHQKRLLFGNLSQEAVGADSISARMVRCVFAEVIDRYPAVSCPYSVVMPNHFHALVVIARADIESAPTVVQIVQAFKRYSTIEYIHLVKQGAAEPFEKYVWQRSFHDHIVRTEDDFRMIAEYIQNNPRRWEEDCFHPTKNPPTKEPPP